MGILRALKKALNDYTQNKNDAAGVDPIIDTDELVQDRLNAMLAVNPSRVDYYQRYQEIVGAYNTHPNRTWILAYFLLLRRETVNAIPAEEITVSLFRDAYPREMIDQLKKQGFIITERHPGIYQISGAGYFVTQLIVTSRLESDQHAVLRILSNHAKQEDVERFIRTTREYVNRGDTARADSVLQVSVSANMDLYRRLRKEDAEMCAALKEIMKEDFDEAEARGESRMATLISKLFSLNRMDDVQRCSSDIEYREKLYKEFKLA